MATTSNSYKKPDSDLAKEAGEYFNRDLSWLEFNRRVMQQFLDKKNPLFERAKFLSIFSSNLDEFFMKRVGYLKRLVASNIERLGPDGIPPVQALALIRQRVLGMLKIQADCYRKDILPELRRNGIFLLEWSDLSREEQEKIAHHFHHRVFPVLTPLAVDLAHPFPFLSNLSVSLGVKLHHPKQKEDLFARVKIPDVLPHWVRVNPQTSDSALRFISLQEIIENNLSELFPEMIIENVMPFRVTRSVAIEQVAEEGEDLLDLVEEELRQRRTAPVIRVEHDSSATSWVLDLLRTELELEKDDFYRLPGPLDYQTLGEITAMPFPNLKFKTWVPVVPPQLTDENTDIFRVIREGDILLHHPYDSFTASVERLIREAVDDPDVLAIKLTLYRTDEDSPFIPLLIEAAEKGKQAVCIVEVKARFEEAKNIYWSEMLEKAGVHVAYGMTNLKTHAKAALIVRREQDDFRFYAHLSTGNYNRVTAKLYTDVGLLTCDAKITGELIELFNYLTGLSLKRNYRKMLVAPITMKDRFQELIRKEAENHQKGKPAHIVAKMNSLEDHRICQSLYEASQAGVPVDLMVRGFCCLVPGVPKLSENIRVTSVIGRFLEHSRIFYFRSGAKNPADGKFFLGSADWMYRNLNNRVESAVPIEQKSLRRQCWEWLQIMLNDRKQAWFLNRDGSYTLLQDSDDPHHSEVRPSQERLMELAQSHLRMKDEEHV